MLQIKPKLFSVEGVVLQFCNPPTLQPEQSGRQGSLPGCFILFVCFQFVLSGLVRISSYLKLI